MNLYAIRGGLAAAAQNADLRLNTYRYLPSKASLPAFIVGQANVEFHQAMGGLSKVTFTCWVCVKYGQDEAAQRRLDEFCGSSEATSLLGAVEADQTLGGVCEALVVRSLDQVTTPIGDSDTYAGRLTVEVYA